MLDSNKTSADLVREYALDHYVHYGFLPYDVEVDGHVFDYGTYNLMIDLFFPEFHREAIHKRIAKLKEGFENVNQSYDTFITVHYCNHFGIFQWYNISITNED